MLGFLAFMKFGQIAVVVVLGTFFGRHVLEEHEAWFAPYCIGVVLLLIGGKFELLPNEESDSIGGRRKGSGTYLPYRGLWKVVYGIIYSFVGIFTAVCLWKPCALKIFDFFGSQYDYYSASFIWFWVVAVVAAFAALVMGGLLSFCSSLLFREMYF